jgi:branched-chain amino acid transport system permease protein
MKLLTLLIGAFLLIIPMLIDNAYVLHSFIMILLYAYLASSWNIVGGFAGQLSFGHSAFLAIGAYTSTILYVYLGLTPWIGMLFGGLAAAILAVLIGLPTFRLRGAYYAIATVAFSSGLVVILSTIKNIGPIQIGAAEGLSVPIALEATFLDFQFLSKVPYYYIILVFTALIVFVSWYIDRSKLGFSLTALREDEDAAKALGINVRSTKLIAAGISAFFTGIGGTFFAQLLRYIEPHNIAGPDFSTQMVLMAIVGGIGTVFGPIIGGILLASIAELTRVYFGASLPPGTHLLIYGIIVIFVILYCPKGIIEPLSKLRGKIVKKSNIKVEELKNATIGN